MSRKKKLKVNKLLTKSEVDLAAQQSLQETGKMIIMNRSLEKSVDVQLLPSLHGMINSSYAVIAAEVDRMALRTRRGPLDNSEVRTFERLTASLVRLANLELNIREQAELDVMSDDKIIQMAMDALKKQQLAAKEGEDES